MMPICPGRRSNQITGGISTNVETPSEQINIGITSNQIDGAGELTVKSGGDLLLDDVNRPSSSFSAPLKLAENAVEWDDLEAAHGGELSIVKMLTNNANELSEKATKTTASMHIYCDGSSGDDANDGLTELTPKKTPSAAIALLPDVIAHNCALHFSGTFSETGSIYLSRAFISSAKLMVDGGDNWTDMGGGSKTVTSGTTTSVTVSGAGWSTDAHCRYLIKFTSGALNGKYYQIFSNTSDTIVPANNFSTAPSNGDTFEIVIPATTFSASSTYSRFYISSNNGLGTVYVQRLANTGSKSGFAFYSNSVTLIMGCIYVDSSYSSAFVIGKNVYSFVMGYLYNPDTFGYIGAATGISQNNGTIKIESCVGAATIYASSFKNVSIIGSAINTIGFGSRVNGTMSLLACWKGGSSAIFRSAGTYRDFQVDSSSGVGLTIDSCGYIDCTKMILSNNGSHGLELLNSKLSATDVISGTGNTGAGAYVHDGAKMTFASGYTPTATGTVGDCAMSDPATQEDTWANIATAGSLVVANELSSVRKV